MFCFLPSQIFLSLFLNNPFNFLPPLFLSLMFRIQQNVLFPSSTSLQLPAVDCERPEQRVPCAREADAAQAPAAPERRHEQGLALPGPEVALLRLVEPLPAKRGEVKFVAKVGQYHRRILGLGKGVRVCGGGKDWHY